MGQRRVMPRSYHAAAAHRRARPRGGASALRQRVHVDEFHTPAPTVNPALTVNVSRSPSLAVNTLPAARSVPEYPDQLRAVI